MYVNRLTYNWEYFAYFTDLDRTRAEILVTFVDEHRINSISVRLRYKTYLRKKKKLNYANCKSNESSFNYY